jgi:hypothetical protein
MTLIILLQEVLIKTPPEVSEAVTQGRYLDLALYTLFGLTIVLGSAIVVLWKQQLKDKGECSKEREIYTTKFQDLVMKIHQDNLIIHRESAAANMKIAQLQEKASIELEHLSRSIRER